MTTAQSDQVDARRRSERVFVAASLALAVLFMGNNLPSALYGVYRVAFGYSPLTQTALYAAAVAVIVPGLVVFGPLSDVVGRRALILAALIAFAIGDVSFVMATDTGWLFVGRVAQGLGIGLGTASAVAALSDAAAGLIPDRVRAQRMAALTATVCLTGGLAVGPLLGGILAQYGPAQRQLSFPVHLAMVVIAFLVALRMPGRPIGRAGRWRPARLAVPKSIRGTFMLVAASGFLAWTVVGIFSALIPSFFGALLGTSNLVVTSGALASMVATSMVVQLFSYRLAAATAQLAGLGTLALGLVLLVGATELRDPVLAGLAMLASGAGHGLIFIGEMSQVTVAAPPNERGAVIGMVYLINYLGLGGPVIGVGFLSLSIGLLEATRLAAVIIATLCVVLIPLVIGGFKVAATRRNEA